MEERGSKTMSIETWLDVCLGDIHAAIDASLPQMEKERGEARAFLERLLGYTPPPELLETLKQVAEAPEFSPLRMGLARVVLALAILVRRELRATELDRLDPETLRRQAAALPAVVRRLEGLEDDIRSMRAEGADESERLRKLRVSLLPSIPRMRGHATLVARASELADSAVAGTLLESHGLTPAEVGWFEAAVGGGAERDVLAPRVLLDAVALRVGLVRDLEAHFRGEAMGAQLRHDVAGYDLVRERLEEEEAAVAARGQAALARRLAAARGDLLRLNRKLSALVRGADARRPRLTAPLRSRRASLLAAAMLVTAGAAVIFLRPGPQPLVTREVAAGPTPRTRTRAEENVEFTNVEQQGEMLVAEMSALSWQRMSDEERHERLYGLGVMAFGRGLREVWIVDGSHNELAKWSKNEPLRILSVGGKEAP